MDSKKMVSIYCIEDIIDLRYVGKTKQTLKKRFNNHLCEKKLNRHNISSKLLNLENSIIYELEKCEEKDSKERESYWINKLNAVNTLKLNVDRKETLRKNARNYWRNNKEEINFRKTWGHLINIDINLFKKQKKK